MLRGKLIAVRRKARELGWSSALRLALVQLWQEAVLRDEILYFADLPAYDEPEPPEGASLQARRVEAADALAADELAALREYGGEGYVEQARARLRDGWILFLGYLERRPAGGAWALTTRTDFTSKVTPLLPSDVAIVDCFTFPAQRSHGVYSYLIARIAAAFREAGFVRAFITVRTTNTASIRGIEKARFVPSVVYRTVRIGRRELVVWKRRAGPSR